MKKIKLQFEKEGEGISKSLSAFVRLGDSIFAAGDEGGDLARLKEFDDGTCFRLKELINLSNWFDFPIPPQKDQTKQVMEVDLEGMDFDYTNQLLWLVGSHSLKRGKADATFDTKKNLELLGKVKPDANRFFLGCMFLHKNKNNQFRLSLNEGANNTRAAQLRCDATTSELLDEIRRDTLFTRFCDQNGGIPGKDNGIDIEGLACVPNGRVLVGMRGPVLRGIATILELAPERIDSPSTKADQLQLTKIGPTGLKYRRHFLDLAGHGVRDLCWDGDDLLVLAGPTTGLDSPPLVFRWKAAIKAFGKMSGDEEKFVWRSENVLVQQSLGSTWKQVETGADHAEAITLFDKKRLMIGYDSPSTKRFHKPASVIVDIVDL
ncbi:DUF3616 domain-containing protein [Nitrosomonas sp.]|uniref:DUF3616 domain-containing protein n=1 Tax=Nitrosomonas sp. TaxID=42353 RepID=UPI00260A1875|nr:DUF3616 domain-containing protein [Nitrosomonas sp.]